MRSFCGFSGASLADLAGNDPVKRSQIRPETALADAESGVSRLTQHERRIFYAASLDELIEIVRDLTRRVAMVEIEIAGRRSPETEGNWEDADIWR